MLATRPPHSTSIEVCADFGYTGRSASEFCGGFVGNSGSNIFSLVLALATCQLSDHWHFDFARKRPHSDHPKTRVLEVLLIQFSCETIRHTPPRPISDKPEFATRAVNPGELSMCGPALGLGPFFSACGVQPRRFPRDGSLLLCPACFALCHPAPFFLHGKVLSSARRVSIRIASCQRRIPEGLAVVVGTYVKPVTHQQLPRSLSPLVIAS
ncbi:uncharacterized protein BO88DRAFT_92809 [Aspergillus vadensis CBS 113365]|uniref:Uncharacterized protein n=1 Tax=Aspergillus vadensis (strain CBS 113365 / IMI 142717 / IBT 24658) TaxID=1448311 RepID=A0A319BJE8_ASPVC|nr:hypothetical protein BO88DRAFT_92809 [Aspergillus vadensis CBS 113365]PYH73316.1 hypothetical protein BO88DRAFT_92809 [Aspergillus vadensis CBS 113365]